MTAKEYLRQYEYANRRVAKLKEEYEKEQALIDTVRSSANVDGMPRAYNINKGVEDRAIRLAMKAAKLKEAELDAIAIRQEVFNVVISVNGVQGDLLYHRYIDLMEWELICVEINYSWAQTHRLHEEALNAAEIIIRERSLFTHDEEGERKENEEVE